MVSLTIEETLAALSHIDAMLAAFADTAPRTIAGMGGIEGLVARSRMTPIGPIPMFTLDEWSAMAMEGDK